MAVDHYRVGTRLSTPQWNALLDADGAKDEGTSLRTGSYLDHRKETLISLERRGLVKKTGLGWITTEDGSMVIKVVEADG